MHLFLHSGRHNGPLYEEAWDKIPDSTKIISELGWKPKYNIDEIINDVISHYRKL